MKKFTDKYLPKLTTRLTVTLAMLMALKFIIGKLSVWIIPGTLKVGFSFVPNVLIGAVAGPILAPITFVLSDIINMATGGGGGSHFILAFTLLEAVQGFFYGLFFYKKKLDAKSTKDWAYTSFAVIVIMLIGTFIFTPLLIQIYFKVPVKVQYFAQGRIFKIFEIPVRIIIIMLIVPALQRIPSVKKYILS
ncbi:folate transporter [Floricoccus tropicus]|uniref:Folate transporter n=1 Tax=Floricoccus tropicus TaxID=1859473 RepID=A0A1E8GKK0_9LACT|nr:folate family ECF transporter S component [Floricoccus tropicus]OFI48717.1 folate transporter [Floricoccus tropicus]